MGDATTLTNSTVRGRGLIGWRNDLTLTPFSRPVPGQGDASAAKSARSIASDASAIAYRRATSPTSTVSLVPPSRTLAVVPQSQVGNACGTTSLSMVLTYFNAPAHARNVKTIDAAIRPFSNDRKLDSFTAPIDIIRYAKQQGFRATLHNDSSTKDLARMIDQGIPPIILYDTDPNQDGTGLHYSVVSAYKDTDGKREWTIADPGGYTWQIATPDLNEKWSNIKVNGVDVPYNRLMLTVAPSKGMVKLPSGNVTPASAIRLPVHNSNPFVDGAAALATDAVGLAADVYDGALAVGGALKTSATWLSKQMMPLSPFALGSLFR